MENTWDPTLELTADPPLYDPRHYLVTVTVVHNPPLYYVITSHNARAALAAISYITPDIDQAFRLAEIILNSPSPTQYLESPLRPNRNSPNRTQYDPRTSISLSDPAREHLSQLSTQLRYSNHRSDGGFLSYLYRLLKANPDPATDWTDTRPTYLTEEDQFRAQRGRPPAWGASRVDPYHERKPISVPKRKLTPLIPPLVALSAHFDIKPYAGRVSPQSQAASVIEAIGNKYLTPTHQAPPNPNPANPHNYRRRYSAKSFELPIV